LFKPREVLDIAIQIEKNGEAIYRNAIQEVSDENLKDALLWMANEEADHIKWFSALKETIQETPGVIAEELSGDMLKGLIGDQSFTLKDVDFSRIDDLGELVGIFIEFEKDSIIFYEMLTPFVKDQETLDHLQKIIAEENQHIKKLECFVKSETATT
jgi:rubrerythrin